MEPRIFTAKRILIGVGAAALLSATILSTQILETNDAKINE